MNRSRFTLPALAVVTLALLLAAPSTASAGWLWAQGNAATLQNTENLDWEGTHYGWGLDFILKQNTGAWVHMPIPTNGNKRRKVQYIKIDSQCASDMTLNTAHVYNGGTQVATFSSLGYTGVMDITLDLVTPVRFDKGLSVSLEYLAGSSANVNDRQCGLFGAGAKFILE